MQLLQQNVTHISGARLATPRLCALLAVSLMFAGSEYSQVSGQSDSTETDRPAVPAAPMNPPADAQEQEEGFGFGFGGGAGFGEAGGLDFGGATMGIPQSAIPGRKWVAGDTVIVAFSDDGKKVFAYSEQHPRWASQDLEPVPGCVAVPVVGDLVAVRLGHNCYAYSPALGTWDVLTLPAGEVAIPMVGTDSASVHSASQGDFVFKSSWGKWFSAEEIKAGRVAEYLLAQRATKQTGQPVLAQVKVLPLKHADAQNAARILEQLLANNGRDMSLAADEVTNSIVVYAAEELFREVESLVKALDTSGKGTHRADPPSQRSGDSDDISIVVPETRVENLRESNNRLERQTRELAAKLGGTSSPQGAARKVTEKQLRDTVRQAFEARQQLQRAELAEFASRLQGIQQSIAMRDRIAQRIIDRRVEELLDPTLTWESTDKPDPRTRLGSILRRADNRTEPVTPQNTPPTPESGANVTPGRWSRKGVELLANHQSGRLQLLTAPENWTLIGANTMVFAYYDSQKKFRLNGIPGRGDANVFVTVEVPEANPGTSDVLLHNPIPLSFRSDGSLDPLFNGERVTKVLYLPRDLSAAGGSLFGTVSSLSLPPGVDAVTEAKKLGIVVAVMRFALDAGDVSAGALDRNVEGKVLHPELEGTWEWVELKSSEKSLSSSPYSKLMGERGSLIIHGNLMSRTSGGRPASETRFTCDFSTTPHRLTAIRVRDGKEFTSRYIVEVSGNILRLGSSMNGSSEFPASFDVRRTIVQVYRRTRDVEPETAPPNPGVDE